MNSIAHIINPFIAPADSDLCFAQPITFQSMILAKEKAKGIINIELFSAHFVEDEEIIPAEFNKTYPLKRSVLDVATFSSKIKLPLLMDILERAYNSSVATYIIYTNVDIGLYPDFYIQVNAFINEGHDAFIINRRRLPAKYTLVSDLKHIWEDFGKPHPGFDCFVFHRSIFENLKLDGVCIGVPFIEISFSQNLFALSNNFKLYDREYLTFHIGEEIYKKRASKEYYNYNKKQFWKLVPILWSKMNIQKFPYSQLFWPKRIIYWGLHPCFPIKLVMFLEWKKLKQKIVKANIS